MKLINMIFRSMVLFVIAAVYFSCKGQTASSAENTELNMQIVLGDTVKTLGDHLWYIYQDKKNNYWFGSNGEGIFYYDGKSILNLTTKHGLSNDSIRQIQEDAFGNMYFSTLGGINKFDGKEIIALQPIKSTDWKLETNDMWFNMLGKKNENGPYRYDGKNLYSLNFPKHYLHDEFYKNGINTFFSPYEVYCIYKDRIGVMWFGTSVFGACRFDGKSVKWMYEKELTIVPNGGSFGIRSIFEDKTGDFWICNTNQRFKMNYEETANSDRLQYDKIAGIGNAEIFDGEEFIYFSYIIEDKNGDIWLTTWSKGVYKYDGTNITHYPVKEGSQEVNLVSMYQDKKGDLWLGTPDNGVFKLIGDHFQKFEPTIK